MYHPSYEVTGGLRGNKFFNSKPWSAVISHPIVPDLPWPISCSSSNLNLPPRSTRPSKAQTDRHQVQHPPTSHRRHLRLLTAGSAFPSGRAPRSFKRFDDRKTANRYAVTKLTEILARQGTGQQRHQKNKDNYPRRHQPGHPGDCVIHSWSTNIPVRIIKFAFSTRTHRGRQSYLRPCSRRGEEKWR